MSAGALRFQAKRLLLPAEGASTLESLVRAKWDRDLPSRRRRGDYRDLEALGRALAGQFSKFTRLLNGDIEGDRHELLFSDFALFYGECLLDLGHLAEEQQIEAGQARFLQKVMLNTAGILDDLYGQGLQSRLVTHLNTLLVDAASQEIDPPEAFRNTIATITSTYGHHGGGGVPVDPGVIAKHLNKQFLGTRSCTPHMRDEVRAHNHRYPIAASIS